MDYARRASGLYVPRDELEAWLEEYKDTLGQVVLPRDIFDKLPTAEELDTRIEGARYDALDYPERAIAGPTAPTRYISSGGWEWYPFSADVARGDVQEIVDVNLFGWVKGFEVELGYFSILELLADPHGYWGFVARDPNYAPEGFYPVRDRLEREYAGRVSLE